jgi:hypothetical protein
MKHFFVSNHECQIGPSGSIYRLQTLGQIIDVEPEEAEHHMRGGCALLTEEEWISCGITPEEQKKYAMPGQRVSAPKEFMEKLAKAWKIFGDKHFAFHHPAPVPEGNAGEQPE